MPSSQELPSKSVVSWPRGSPKTGHRGSLQNRPTITIIQDVDFDARVGTLGRCEQCLERGKETTSYSIGAARLVAAQDSEDHRCASRNRRCLCLPFQTTLNQDRENVQRFLA